jgi:hypothetical protein
MAAIGAMRGGIVGALVGAVVTAGGMVPADEIAHVIAIPIAYAITLPLSYYIGWRIPFRVPPLLRGGIEWSEFLTGASRALVFVGVFGA